jgi:tetratricopeptide (TPR) repeat protein
LEVNLISEISKYIHIDSKGIDKDIFMIELIEKKLIIRCTKFYAIHIDNFFNKSLNVEKVSNYISFYLLFLLLKLTKSYDYLLACIGILTSNDINIETSMYWSLIDISFEVRHYEQSCVLIESGIKKDLISIFDEESLMSILFLICEINDKRIVNKIMLLIEEAILSSSIDDGAKARACYNLGNKYRCIVRDHKKAIHMYNMASKYDKSYKERDYFNTEIGNSLFLLNKFIFSSYFFAKSFFLSSEPINLFYLADSKLYSGKYKEANCFLQDVIKNQKNKEIFYFSEAILKEVFTRYLYENYTEEQNRNIEKAYEVFDKKVFNFETMIEGLGYDFLNEALWFNLGILYSKENKHEYAFLYFVFCTILVNNDYESYVNAIIAYLNINKCQEYYHLLYTLLLN